MAAFAAPLMTPDAAAEDGVSDAAGAGDGVMDAVLHVTLACCTASPAFCDRAAAVDLHEVRLCFSSVLDACMLLCPSMRTGDVCTCVLRVCKPGQRFRRSNALTLNMTCECVGADGYAVESAWRASPPGARRLGAGCCMEGCSPGSSGSPALVRSTGILRFAIGSASTGAWLSLQLQSTRHGSEHMLHSFDFRPHGLLIQWLTPPTSCGRRLRRTSLWRRPLLMPWQQRYRCGSRRHSPCRHGVPAASTCQQKCALRLQ